jgi:transcription elongation GreA/GreB family factor
LDESLNESLDVNKRKISQLIEENSLLKKNLSFAQDSNKENEERFVEGKIKKIEEMIGSKQIKIPSSYRRT